MKVIPTLLINNYMKKNKFLFLTGLILGLMLVGGMAIAAEEINQDNENAAKISFPITELGNCPDKTACRVYCDQQENMLKCLDFAENKSLLPAAEINIARKAVKRIMEGTTPGQCQDKESCEKFCKGNVESMTSCIAFAEEVGALQGLELERARKVAQALKKGASLPGGCTDGASCESYCANGTNIDVCLDFAEKAELMSPEELAEAKKVAPFLKNGQTPGRCQTKNDCQLYCEDEAHFEECLNFAESANFISKEEAELARKTGGKGPGNCKNQQACQQYCNDPKNNAECLQFANQYGLITQEEKELMENGVEKIREGFEKIPAEAKAAVESCLESAFNGHYQEIMSGSLKPTKQQGEKIGPCFEDTMKKYAESQLNNALQNANLPAGVNLEEIKNSLPTNRPPTDQEIEDLKSKYQPTEIPKMPEVPTTPPSTPPTDMPQNIPQGYAPQNVPQGPPCSSEEECRAMFGQ